MRRGFLTVAYGAPKYVRMGKALARSIRLYNGAIPIAVVTDSHDREIRSLFDIVVPFNPEYGDGVKQKLYLDRYTPFEETIFIDSDCLVYRDPGGLWEMYKRPKKGFGVRAWRCLGPKDSHYSVKKLEKYLAKHGVSKIVAFNSGLFFFDSSRESKAVFETARSLCDDEELKPFKNSILNDEPVFAMAMEINRVEAIDWDEGESMSTLSGDIKQCSNINVLKGKSKYIKNGRPVNPIVIHFHFHCQEFFVYKRDMMRLAIMRYPWASVLANFFTLPDYLASRIRRYPSRMVQRKKKYGYLGLAPVPERIVCKLATPSLSGRPPDRKGLFPKTKEREEGDGSDGRKAGVGAKAPGLGNRSAASWRGTRDKE